MHIDLIEAVENHSPLVATKTLIGKADDLAREHEEFNDRYIVSGRKALYELLGKIYALVEQLDGCSDKENQVAILRKVLSEKYGIRTQENTSDTTVLVRYITQADRKTAHVYSRAIETARLNKIDSSKFAGYVEQAGGVERIRTEGADSDEDDFDKRMSIARMYLNSRKVFPLTSFKLNPKSNIHLEGSSDLNILICSESEGRQYVLAKLPIDSGLEKKVFDGLVRQLPNDLKDVCKQVTKFHKKAKKKQSQNTFKAIVKKRPALAAGMLRNQKIRNLVIVQSNKGE